MSLLTRMPDHDAPAPPPGKPAYVVAVLGAHDLADAEYLRRLLPALINHYRDDHAIWVVTAGPDSPELRPVTESLGWLLVYEPDLGDRCRQDHSILALAHAVVVLGEPGPWRRLLRLAQEARIPTRVYRTLPRLPPPRVYDAHTG